MRFKIKKYRPKNWHIYKLSEESDGNPTWRFLTNYATFEEARAKTAFFVDTTVAVLGSFKGRKSG